MLKAFADVDLETHAKVRLLECIVMPSKENVDAHHLLEHVNCLKSVIIPMVFAIVARVLLAPTSRLVVIVTQ